MHIVKNWDIENGIVRNLRTVLGVLCLSVQRFWRRHDTIKKQLPFHVSSPELSPEGERGETSPAEPLATVQLGKRKIHFTVDTGATYSVKYLSKKIER